MEEFEEEQGQIDHTLAHAVERLPFHVCEHAGFDWIKVARPEFFTQTPGIVSVKNASELDQFFERYLFRVSDPKPAALAPEPWNRGQFRANQGLARHGARPRAW